MSTYITLDLETTGFDPVADQVLEIAAIKFENDQIIDTFETLINPGTEIPSMVTHITGIKAEDVANAPELSSVKADLMNFIGNYPIIGHNIDFDLTFLKAKGLPIINPQYDTYQLSCILIPNLPSYSLDTISRVLKLEHENKHRALSDAKACFHLFQILQAKIANISPEIYEEIKNLIIRQNWSLKNLFLHPTFQAQIGTSTTIKPEEKQPQTKVELAAQIPGLKTFDDLINAFGSAGVLSDLLNNYEPRPSQSMMSQRIFKSFLNKTHLLVEAGTGTGKTMAYLIAACMFSQISGEKIIISTHTNNLQDQLVNKDFPLIQKIFPSIKLAVLKGKKKYFSWPRFLDLKNQDVLEEHEIAAIIKILLWLQDTVTGDLDELNLQNKELSVLDQISSDDNDEIVTEKTPPQYLFLKRARKIANESDLIIINHALLLQDALSENNILPNSKHLIVDEAHHLDKIATDAISVNLTFSSLKRPVEQLAATLRQVEHNLFDNNALENIILVQCNALTRNIEDLFDTVENIVKEYLEFHPNTFQLIVLKKQMTPEHWDHLAENLNLVYQTLTQIYNNLLKIIPQENFEQKKNKLLDIAKVIQKNLNSVITVLKSDQEQIVWLNQTMENTLQIQAAPINISNFIHQKLLNNKDSVVLTSATLTTNHNFKFFRRELGLGEEFEEVILPSHFSYPDQVKILIPNNLPDPTKANNEYLEQCSKIIASLIEKNGGKALVLFTAKKDLSRVFHKLAPDLKSKGITLLAQSLSGGRGKIIAHFKDEPEKSAIMGTNSFWEGVDILGDTLNLLMIQKLPFDPPDDPIAQARGSKYEQPFEEFSLPRAILRFKQGFGRLIRSSTDTGTVVILDSRLVQKSYGIHFLESLPSGITTIQCSAEKLFEKI